MYPNANKWCCTDGEWERKGGPDQYPSSNERPAQVSSVVHQEMKSKANIGTESLPVRPSRCIPPVCPNETLIFASCCPSAHHYFHSTIFPQASYIGTRRPSVSFPLFPSPSYRSIISIFLSVLSLVTFIFSF